MFFPVLFMIPERCTKGKKGSVFECDVFVFGFRIQPCHKPVNERQSMVSFAEWVLNLTCCSMGTWCAVPAMNPLERKEGVSVSGRTVGHLEMAPATPSLLLIQQIFHTQTL